MTGARDPWPPRQPVNLPRWQVHLGRAVPNK